MAEPRSQWQGKLGDLVEKYYQADQAEKKAQEAKKKLKGQIVEIAKERGIKEFRWQELRLVYFVRFKLPGDVSLLRKVLGNYWPMVARRKIKYDINRERIEGRGGYLDQGKIDKEAWQKILIGEDNIKVEKLGK